MTGRNAIVLAADKNWFAPGAFVADQLANLHPPANVDVIIASTSVADVEKAAEFGLPCEFLLLDDKLGAGFPVPERLSIATYFRICLPALLGERYRRILYLDVDIYVHSATVFKLFDLDMGGKSIAGVRDAWASFLDRDNSARELKAVLGDRHRKYLNAGILLMDTERFRAEQIESRLLTIIRTVPDRLQFADQSALNIVLDGDWQELSPAFNTTSPNWASFCREVSDPVIVHFVGAIKPWMGPRFNVDHPARRDLERFLRKSPWSAFLSQFYSFEDAWRVLGSGQPPTTPPLVKPRMPLTPVEARRIADYLRTTRFADVEQHITELKLDRIPRGL